jgi:DNA-binding transcriptional LysR family regulator
VDAKIDLNDAAVFVRVAQAGSFSAIANERGVPVSTVSRSIKRLEAGLGIGLLERTTRRLCLTDAGKVYLVHAERAVQDLLHGHARVRDLRKEPSGRVRVLAPIFLGAAIASVVYSYLAKYPKVSLDLELDTRRVDLLAEGFDLAVLTGRVDTGDFVARELWPASRKLLYASPGYLEARGTPREVDDLAGHDCIALHASEAIGTWTLSQGRRQRRFFFKPRFYVNEFGAAHGATLAGLGVAMLPEVLCAEDVAAGRLVRVLDTWQGESSGVYLLYRAQRSRTAAVQTCIDHFLAGLPGKRPVRRPSRTSA